MLQHFLLDTNRMYFSEIWHCFLPSKNKIQLPFLNSKISYLRTCTKKHHDFKWFDRFFDRLLILYRLCVFALWVTVCFGLLRAALLWLHYDVYYALWVITRFWVIIHEFIKGRYSNSKILFNKLFGIICSSDLKSFHLQF